MSLLYGVNKATLDAYVAAERAKVWEAVIAQLGTGEMNWLEFDDWCRAQAAKETQP